MYCINPVLSQRLEIIKISKSQKWPNHKYLTDDFYKYSLSNAVLPIHCDPESYFCFVCYHRLTGEFVGYVQGYLPAIKMTLWIQTFLIDQKYLRQGYGTEFYTAVIHLLGELVPIEKIYLACYKSNLTGLHFWKCLGYTKTNKISQLCVIPNHAARVDVYEKSMLSLIKESFYEQENIKNLRVQ